MIYFATNAKKTKLERYYSNLTAEAFKRTELIFLKCTVHKVFILINNPPIKSLRLQLVEACLIRMTTRIMKREDTDGFKLH